MSVALDTMVLIWGLATPGARRGNPRQKNLLELQRRSLILIDVLEGNDQRIIVPSVTVGELLLGVESSKHDDFLAEVEQRFFCPPYDVKASAIAAKLWLQHRGLPKSQQLERNVLKSEVMIIATALANGATTFYSHETNARRLAKQAGLQALDLPERHPDMHVDAEIRQQLGLPPQDG